MYKDLVRVFGKSIVAYLCFVQWLNKMVVTDKFDVFLTFLWCLLKVAADFYGVFGC